MKNLITTLKNIWKIEDLRTRILVTLGFILIYRLGAQVPLPGIDASVLAAANEASGGPDGLLGLLNLFTGGAFAQASIFALGIMPYISASIVIQLMGVAVPYFQKLQREGESGRRKINNITRYLTILITGFQAPGFIANLKSQWLNKPIQLADGTFGYVFANNEASVMFTIMSVLVLVTGTMFVMWLGEKITDRGIGNGISLLITVGIIASLPLSFTQEVISQLSGSGGLIMIAIEFVIWIIVIALCILLVLAVRQIPVQYARRSVAGSGPTGVYSKRQYIPLRLNASGVMPIIFAQAIMFAPAYLGQLIGGSFGQWMNTAFSNMFGLSYNILFGLLIILFTYFYTAITVPTNKMADDLKRSGGFIPGIKPGGETADFLDKIMSLITFPGSLFLAAISVLPAVIVALMNIQQGWALFYGGTSLLIMVGVAIDTIQQINAYLLNRHYDGLMKSGKTRRVA